MEETIRLTSAKDGFSFSAFRVTPEDARLGGLVLVQEIFGVTEHIKDLCRSFAAEGFEVIAPSLFDRDEPGFAADYDAEGVTKGRTYSEKTPWDQVEGDLRACVQALEGPVFVTGFCWGGTAAWLAACRIEGVAAASGFYGRRIPELIEETPRAPVILHFGKTDPTIPMETVETIRERHPEVPVFVYEAGHGFVSDRRADHDADAAALGRLRTLQVFRRNAGLSSEAP